MSRNGLPMRRRALLGGAALVAGIALLPGCATPSSGSRVDFAAAVQRLLERSTRNAFDSLTAPDGFWTSAVARVDMPTLFGKSDSLFKGILAAPAFREKLQRRLNRFAEDAARKAAPVVAEAVRSLSVPDAYGVLRSGEPTAATTVLRAAMGPSLVNAMIPELDRVMRAANDPVLTQALSVLAGVNIGDAAQALALETDNAIWYEVGAQEARIRENPAATGDALLIAALSA
ncbi:hypothetical protein B2G71_07855 [Novosphingobium sp. PC22D]|nr:hypothetical protein B2G71_07855 [Novosphingobium sp. PC22D]